MDNLKFSLRIEDLIGLDYAQMISNNAEKVRKNKARKSAGGRSKRGRRNDREAQPVPEDSDEEAGDADDGAQPGNLSIRVALSELF